jgi:single-strand DNA-binding protein
MENTFSNHHRKGVDKMNESNLMGRLTKDPELKYTPQGEAVTNFTLAVNRPFAKDGQQSADFINCVIWGKRAEALANYSSKGNRLAVTGRIQTRSFDNQEGKRVFVVEVYVSQFYFIETKGENQSNQSGGGYSNQSNQDPFRDKGQPIDIQDDDLPF